MNNRRNESDFSYLKKKKINKWIFGVVFEAGEQY